MTKQRISLPDCFLLVGLMFNGDSNAVSFLAFSLRERLKFDNESREFCFLIIFSMSIQCVNHDSNAIYFLMYLSIFFLRMLDNESKTFCF